MVTVTRRLHFSAAHRVHNPAMSDEENRRTFGKCNNPNWHGHNYILDVSVRGAVDARTGYVIDLSRVKQIVEQEVIAKVDHRNLVAGSLQMALHLREQQRMSAEIKKILIAADSLNSQDLFPYARDRPLEIGDRNSRFNR